MNTFEPMGLYIHIPYCLSKCSYCDFFSIPLGTLTCQKIPNRYIDALLEEFFQRKEQFHIESFSTVYFGGGTPSLLSEQQLERLFQNISPFIKEKAEITFECNPDDITVDFLTFLAKCGITRLSLGIQTLQNTALKMLGRRASAADTRNALQLIKKHWQGQFSCDLIAGLPFVSNENFLEDLDELFRYHPHHISCYALTLEEGTRLYEQIARGEIVLNQEYADEQWLLARDYLEQNGYFQYEISNFSLKGFESKHNKGYWLCQNYLGLGSGATGTVNSYRYTNTSQLDAYLKNPFDKVCEEKLDRETKIFEFFMLGFRLVEGISRTEFKKKFAQEIDAYLEPTFSCWKKKGLAVQQGDTYKLSQRGLLFLNSFLEELL
ncbi:MAG: radical SAM family heme chaperone HemW [Spirochaetaceae bacterium]|nr:radical SAM family heme chaperone HemW [Spirochaetaceae bacterium]